MSAIAFVFTHFLVIFERSCVAKEGSKKVYTSVCVSVTLCVCVYVDVCVYA